MKKMKKCLAVCLVIFALVSCFSIAAFAAEQQEDALDFVLWSDKESVTRGDKEYTLVGDIVYYDTFRPYAMYQYLQTVLVDDYWCMIGQPMYRTEDGGKVICDEIVCLYESLYGGKVWIYATEEGYAMLSAFANGSYARYALLDGYSYGSEMDSATVSRLVQTAPNGNISVFQLRNADQYEVVGYDESLTVAHTVGSVFVLDGIYIYVHYETLPNSCFDSEGDLSLRQGTIPVAFLEGKTVEAVGANIEAMQLFEIDVEYEVDTSTEVSLIGTVLCFLMLMPVLFGVPIFLLLVSVACCFIRALPRKKYWIALACLALLWLLGALGATGVLIAVFVLAL